MLANHQTPTRKETSPSIASTSPLEVNEILSHIFSFLSQSILKSVVNRVSRRWLSVANSLSHRHLVLSQNDVNSFPKLRKKLLLATELTVRWTPRHWTQIMNDKQIELFDKLMTVVANEISDIDSDTGSSGGDEQRGACFRRLNLNLEQWWYGQQVLLSFFHPTRLTHLSMDVPYSAGAVYMKVFLDQCPNLLSLTVSGLKTSTPATPATSVDHAWLYGNSMPDGQDCNIVDTTQNSWPLQRLRLDALHVSPEALETYFPGLKQLQVLHLLAVKVPKTGAPLSFDDEETKLKFWTNLKESCPRLEAIHYSNECKLKSDLPVELFAGSKVHSWGIDCTQETLRLALTRLSTYQLENNLTTLEIIPRKSHEGSNPTLPITPMDRQLREFLCSAPSLIHLKVSVSLTLNAFWDRDNVNDAASRWMCRGLRTLSLCLLFVRYNGPFIWSGHLFGYLSRICPHLHELSLEIRGQVLVPESGLCLLTRMRELRRLTIYTELPERVNYNGLDRADFAWIRGGAPPPTQFPPKPPRSLMRRFTSFLLNSGSVFSSWEHPRSLPPPPLAHKDYELCLHRIQKNMALPPNLEVLLGENGIRIEEERALLQREQVDNAFSSDYERSMPMVDGLKDFQFCGSYLDIEACLHAQLFRLRQIQDVSAISEANDKNASKAVPSATSFDILKSQPWPDMESFELTFAPSQGRQDTTVRRQAEEGRQILMQLRPDIDFSCQFT